jgi:hypothetical protein
MANLQPLKISGMLNQHEFTARYIFTKQRIINGFARQEMAFLLGRTIHDLTDYEQLGAHVKMSYQDHEIMATVFKRTAPAVPMFYAKSNDIDISNDRRMIRGTVTETGTQRSYEFIHPWKMQGEKKPVILVEDLGRDGAQDVLITEFIQEQLGQLKAAGCFDRGCTALFLYQQLKQVIDKEWQLLFLKMLRITIYAHIHAQDIRVHQIDGQLIYKTKS